MQKNKIKLAVLDGIIRHNAPYVAESNESVKDYHMRDFNACPEGWDCIFYGKSWDVISNADRKERKDNFIFELNSY